MPITYDGDWPTPLLLGRIPRDSGLPAFIHYIWTETFVQNKANYYPLQIGQTHPDELEDPHDPNLTTSSSGGNIFDLTSGGQGSPLYLIDETVERYVGNRVVFTRKWSSLPQTWTDTEFGYYLFPGFKTRDVNNPTTQLIITAQPATRPVTFENEFKYYLGAPTALPQQVTQYKVFNGDLTDYRGSGFDQDGSIRVVYDMEGRSQVSPALNETLIDSVRVTRWKGEIFQVETKYVITRYSGVF